MEKNSYISINILYSDAAHNHMMNSFPAYSGAFAQQSQSTSTTNGMLQQSQPVAPPQTYYQNVQQIPSNGYANPIYGTSSAMATAPMLYNNVQAQQSQQQQLPQSVQTTNFVGGLPNSATVATSNISFASSGQTNNAVGTVFGTTTAPAGGQQNANRGLYGNGGVSAVSQQQQQSPFGSMQNLPYYQYQTPTAGQDMYMHTSSMNGGAPSSQLLMPRKTRADRRVYPISNMKFGHKKTHITTTLIGTKGEDTIHQIYVMIQAPAVFHKSAVPVNDASCSRPGQRQERRRTDECDGGSSSSGSGSDDEHDSRSDRSNLTHRGRGRRQQRGSGSRHDADDRRQPRGKRSHSMPQRQQHSSRCHSSDDEEEEQEQQHCNNNAGLNRNCSVPAYNGAGGSLFHGSLLPGACPAPGTGPAQFLPCVDPNNFDPYRTPYVRRVDRFGRVAPKKAVLKKNGNRLCSTYSVITEILDNVYQLDQESWERIGRYGDDNVAERTLDTADSAYYIVDLRFPFCVGGLPNFLFDNSGFELEIEWECLDQLFEWSDEHSKPYVLDGPRPISSRDVTAEIKVFSSMLSEEVKNKWRVDLFARQYMDLSWDEYVPHTQFVKNLPIDDCDTDDTRCRVFSLSKFLTGSARGIYFFVKREENHRLKRHFDFTGEPCGRHDDPLIRYRVTRGNVDLIEWTDALEARTINFEREFQGRSPKDLRVYYENLESLETQGFLDVSLKNDVKLEVTFQKNLGKVFFHMFVQVLNVIRIAPVDLNNPNAGFQIDSAYYRNEATVERVAGLLKQESQPYLQQMQQRYNNSGHNGYYTGY